MSTAPDNTGTTVHNAIREMILNRELLPGDKINQIGMATRLKVSRTPIINALHRLESEGLVDRLQNSGFYVHRLSIRELQDLFDLREALDIVIMKSLVREVADKEIDELESIFAHFIDAPREIDREEYRRMDMRFHSTLVGLCSNSMVRKVNENLQILARAYTAGLIRPFEETLQEHVNIISALRERNAERAEREMRLHITRTTDMIRETVAGLLRMGLDPDEIHVDEISLNERGSVS